MIRKFEDNEKFSRVIEDVKFSIEKLNMWILINGWSGYDPYDIKAHPFIRYNLYPRKRNVLSQSKRMFIWAIINLFPSYARRLFKVKPQINAKAMGLFAKAYLNLYKVLKNSTYLNKSSEAIEWLIDNCSNPNCSGKCCWGYPFDWQSLVFIPKMTPSSVVTAICGDAFWEFYKFTNSIKYLKICERICRFFIDDLNINYIGDGEICFSYTPVDTFRVHNANLFVSEFLIRTGKEVGNEVFTAYGLAACNYTLGQQQLDGSFTYWGKDRLGNVEVPTKFDVIDHYHTGFVLRSLCNIYAITKEANVKKALYKGYKFYKEKLFDNKKVPKMTPSKKYPIDIHSCAEAIITMSKLSEYYPDALDYALNVFYFVTSEMQDRKGFFYYRKYRLWTDKTPYIRWGQAWMLLALSQLLMVLHSKLGQGR